MSEENSNDDDNPQKIRYNRFSTDIKNVDEETMDGQEGSWTEDDQENGWTEESDVDETNQQTVHNNIITDDPENPEENIKYFIKINEKNPQFFTSNYNDKFKNIHFNLILTIIIIFIAIFLSPYIYNKFNSETKKIDKIDDKQIRIKALLKNLKELTVDFPGQTADLWETLFVGIKYVNESKPTRPAVFTLLHNHSSDVAECLAFKIGNAATKFLNTPGAIQLIGESTMTDYDNELISNYKLQLEQKNVMIIYRLDQMPGLVAKSFHSFCDRENPLVKRAVFLFTLDSSQLDDFQNYKPNKRAKEIMISLWNKTLVDSNLNPLITRLTDTVLEINSEKNHKGCY